MAYKKNPFETIISLEKKQARALEHLLKKVSEEDAVAGLRKIRRQLKEDEKQGKMRSFAFKRIHNLLRDYPGFEKEILKTLNARIKEARQKGELHKFMSEEKKAAEIRKAARKKIKQKAKEAVPVKMKTESKDSSLFKTNYEDYDSKTLKVELDIGKPEVKTETSPKSNVEAKEKAPDKPRVESKEISRLNVNDEEPDFNAVKDELDKLGTEEKNETSQKSNVEAKEKMSDKPGTESKYFSRPIFRNEDYDSKTVEFGANEDISKEDNTTQSDRVASAKKDNNSNEQPPEKPESKSKDKTPFFIGDEEFTSRTMEIDMDNLLTSKDEEGQE